MNCHPTSHSQLSVDLKAASARSRSEVKRHGLSNYCRDVVVPRYHVRIDTRLSPSFSIFRRGEGKAWERIILPTGSVFLKQRVGYRVGQGFISGLYQKHCGGGYRSRYTYFSNLVARTRLLRGGWKLVISDTREVAISPT